MEFPFIRYGQPGGEFYACIMQATDIVYRLEVRRRSEDRLAGIQRDENDKRVRDICVYLRTPAAILPTPIIVSAFEGEVEVRGGALVLSDGSTPVGHILDGQHRVLGLLGLTKEELSLIDLLVVFVFGIEPYAEATVFSTINSNQRQVSKSLIYDLFGLSPHRTMERVGHEICKSLSDDAASPFYGKIKLLGKKMEDSETLSQAAFVDHLLVAMKTKEGVLNSLYENKEDWAIRKILSNAFSAVLEAVTHANAVIPPDYFFRTTGYGGLMKALPVILKSGWKDGSLDMEFFRRIFVVYFRALRDLPAGTGNSAMLEIKRGIIRENSLSQFDA